MRLVAVLVLAALPLAMGAAAGSADDRVVNGKPVPAGKYPFLVYVDGPRCTGSLIAAEWVLTAAHCVVENGQVEPPSAFEVVLFSPVKSEGWRMGVKEVVSHPDYYKGNRLINDVALLRLAEPVGAEHAVRYPGKGETRFERPGQRVMMVGFGATNPEGTRFPERAQEAPGTIVPFKACKKAWGDLTPEIVCAAGKRGADTCGGDSGGPLLARTPNGWVQVGALSFGPDPCRGGEPAGYTRLSHPIIADFIAETIAGRSR